METLKIIALCLSGITIASGIIMLVYTLRVANLRKPHVKLILTTQIVTTCIQTGLLISYILYLSDTVNSQYHSIITAFLNYGATAGIFAVHFFKLEILKIFSIYDPNITITRFLWLRRICFSLSVLLGIPGVIFYTYLAIMNINNEDLSIYHYSALFYGTTWVYGVSSFCIGHCLSFYFVYLVVVKNDSIIEAYRVRIRFLVSLNAFMLITDVAGATWSVHTPLQFPEPVIAVSVLVATSALSGFIPTVCVVLFYGLQEIALHKAMKRKEAEKAKALNKT